ncbi:MAG: gas vesicle protein [Akkermansiaceae bacterium]|jgi:gas vesicle protein
MKILITSLFVATATLQSYADSISFSCDRAAILAMVGKFEVEFNFTETVALAKDYELKKPYTAKAHELVKVAEDKGRSITLQHLLVFEDETGPSVIKHWAQIWKYEDAHTLTYEGKKTWLPVTHSAEETKGTWTQFVTQTDDSPRYKAQGKWSHMGNSSAWTSSRSTRPLPRRDYSKRDDYDLLMVVNQHIITPEGWVHHQDNRKLVSREGRSEFLCVEAGLNHYKRITDDTGKEGFAIAEKQWEKSHEFWKEVRSTWKKHIAESSEPIRYASRIGANTLMSELNSLARKIRDGETVESKQVKQAITKYFR